MNQSLQKQMDIRTSAKSDAVKGWEVFFWVERIQPFTAEGVNSFFLQCNMSTWLHESSILGVEGL